MHFAPRHNNNVKTRISPFRFDLISLRYGKNVHGALHFDGLSSPVDDNSKNNDKVCIEKEINQNTGQGSIL